MGCETVAVGDGLFAIACSRGKRRKSCSVEGCRNAATKACDFPLTGRKAGKTCDRDLCASCAVKVGTHGASSAFKGDSVDYCPPHAKQVRLPGATR